MTLRRMIRSGPLLMALLDGSQPLPVAPAASHRAIVTADKFYTVSPENALDIRFRYTRQTSGQHQFVMMSAEFHPKVDDALHISVSTKYVRQGGDIAGILHNLTFEAALAAAHDVGRVPGGTLTFTGTWFHDIDSRESDYARAARCIAVCAFTGFNMLTDRDIYAIYLGR